LLHSVGTALPLAAVTGSAGGGSAQTRIAVGKMAKAAISPQLRNLRMVFREKIGVFSQSN
jgi:hypothetical protein